MLLVDPHDDHRELDNRLQNVVLNDPDDHNSVDSGEGSIIENDAVEVIDLAAFSDSDNDDGVVIEDGDMDIDAVYDGDFDQNVGGNQHVGDQPIVLHPIDDLVRPVVTFSGHTDEVYCSDIEPINCALAVTGGQDTKALVWDLNTGESVFECTGHTNSVISVAYSHDGAYLATGDMSGLVQVWKIPEKSPIWSETLNGFQWLLWHRESHILFAAQRTGDIFIWRIPSGQCKVLPGHGTGTECSALTFDGKRIVVGYDDFCVKVFDIKTETVVASYRLGPDENNDRASEIDIGTDNDCFAAGFINKTVLIASSQSNKEYMRIVAKGTVEAVKLITSHNIPMVAIGSVAGLEIWEYTTQSMRYYVECSPINHLVYDLPRKLVYAASSSGEVFVIDTMTANIRLCFMGECGNIFHITLSKDNLKLVTVSRNRVCDSYNLKSVDEYLQSHQNILLQGN